MSKHPSVKKPAAAPKADAEGTHQEQALSGAKLLSAIAHAHLTHVASKPGKGKKSSPDGAPPSDGPADGEQ